MNLLIPILIVFYFIIGKLISYIFIKGGLTYWTRRAFTGLLVLFFSSYLALVAVLILFGWHAYQEMDYFSASIMVTIAVIALVTIFIKTKNSIDKIKNKKDENIFEK